MRDYAAIGVVFAQALAGGDGESGEARFFYCPRKAESYAIEQSVCRAVMLKIHKAWRVFNRLQNGVGELYGDRNRVRKRRQSVDGRSRQRAKTDCVRAERSCKRF